MSADDEVICPGVNARRERISRITLAERVRGVGRGNCPTVVVAQLQNRIKRRTVGRYVGSEADHPTIRAEGEVIQVCRLLDRPGSRGPRVTGLRQRTRRFLCVSVVVWPESQPMIPERCGGVQWCSGKI